MTDWNVNVTRALTLVGYSDVAERVLRYKATTAVDIAIFWSIKRIGNLDLWQCCFFFVAGDAVEHDQRNLAQVAEQIIDLFFCSFFGNVIIGSYCTTS